MLHRHSYKVIKFPFISLSRAHCIVSGVFFCFCLYVSSCSFHLIGHWPKNKNQVIIFCCCFNWKVLLFFELKWQVVVLWSWSNLLMKSIQHCSCARQPLLAPKTQPQHSMDRANLNKSENITKIYLAKVLLKGSIVT